MLMLSVEECAGRHARVLHENWSEYFSDDPDALQEASSIPSPIPR